MVSITMWLKWPSLLRRKVTFFAARQQYSSIECKSQRNTFTPAATQAQFKFTKKLEGKELTKDAFIQVAKMAISFKPRKCGWWNYSIWCISFDKKGSLTHTHSTWEVAGRRRYWNIWLRWYEYPSCNSEPRMLQQGSWLLMLQCNGLNCCLYLLLSCYRFDFTKKLAGRKKLKSW